VSIRDVVELFSLAQQGIDSANASGDEVLLHMSNQLVTKALQHPDAPILLTAMYEAAKKIQESPFGNDPDLEDNDGVGIFNPEGEDVGDGAKVEDKKVLEKKQQEQQMQQMQEQQQMQQGQPQQGQNPQGQPPQGEEEQPDEDSDAASPSYEGVTDGEDDDLDENHRGKVATSNLLAVAARNLASLNNRVLVYNDKGKAIGHVASNANSIHAERVSGLPMKMEKINGKVSWVPCK